MFIDDNKFYIVSKDENEDRPVKIILEHPTLMKETKKDIIITDYEIIVKILREALWDKLITIEQYRSTRGQFRKGNTKDPLLFIEKLGLIEKYKNEHRTETVSMVSFKSKVGIPLDLNFGIYKIMEEDK